MTEEECRRFLQEDLALLRELAENSRKQLRVLQKRQWQGLRRLTAERDQWLARWQARQQLRAAARQSQGALADLCAAVRLGSAEVQRLHMQLYQAAREERNYQAQQLQRLRLRKVAARGYDAPGGAACGRQCNIQG